MKFATMFSHHLQRIQLILIRAWYNPHPIKWLIPISWLFSLVILMRRFLYRIHLIKQHSFSVPVIIVGNISVGGNGKTPCVIALTHYLRQRGMQPGIVSRGYGGSKNKIPHTVQLTDTASDVGDEALLLKQRCQCPVVIAKKRADAVDHLLKTTDCNVVISDDGLQHYALARTVEIIMMDGTHGLGNQYCLPAGPLREPVSRIQQSDAIVLTGNVTSRSQLATTLKMPPTYIMSLAATVCYQLHAPDKQVPLTQLAKQTVHAVAGIAHPSRFFTMLSAMNIHVIEHAFADHYAFQAVDFADFADECILLTEKDAVKCQHCQLTNAWVVPVEGLLPDAFYDIILKALL